ncbi:MAG: SDR family oxidoreductase [Gammaproteobacteria bacterium]
MLYFGAMGPGAFRNQVVWITGASSGVGEGLAVAFAEAGARVVISARRAAELARVRARMADGDHLVLPMDVTDYSSLAEKVALVLDRLGRIDVLVCNAGISQRSRFAETTLDVFRTIMEVNVMGPAAHIHAVLPVMRAQGGGHVVVTSSVAGKFGIPNRSAYCASKHAVHGLCDALRAEHGPDRIHFSTLIIAAVKSDVNANAFKADGSKVGKDSKWGRGAGMDAVEAGRLMVRKLARRDEEIVVVANWRAGVPLYQQRLDPRLVYRRMARLAFSKWWS